MNLLMVLNKNGLLPVTSGKEMLVNLKRNWYFFLSAMGLLCLSLDDTSGYFMQIPVIILGMLFVTSQISSLMDTLRAPSLPMKILSGLSAIGFCLGNLPNFRQEAMAWLEDKAPAEAVISGVGIAAAVLAVFFVYFFLLVFWKEMGKLLRQSGFFRDLTRAEIFVYGLLLLVILVFMVHVFAGTDGFYGTKYDFDVIFTSDSPYLVKTNVYLTLTHLENDLRQPLFAVFAAPFLGIPSLLGQIFGATPAVKAILLNSVQVGMLLMANLMLSKMMGLTPGKRICFMLLMAGMYTMPLFVLMMEQYIVAYFWMVLTMYLVCEKKQGSRLPLWGAGGTLLTSLALLPFCSDKHPIRQFGAWFWDMVRFCVEFGLVLMVFCRLDVIFNLVAQVDFLTTFTGEALTLLEKFFQYTSFVSGCFAAPATMVKVFPDGFASWQLVPVTGLNLVGVVILVLSAVSALWNCRNRSSQLAALWIAMSVVLLIGLGWGTIENGLILYALYFGWAFLLLLYQLVEKIGTRLKLPILVPVCTAVAIAVMAAINIPAIREMVDFAISYYPI